MVLDANVLIALLDSENSSHQRSRNLLETHADEQWSLSTLTLAEILVGPARAGKLVEAQLALDQLDLRVESLSGDAAVSIAALRAGTSLKMRDCCVLLIAEHLSCPLATFDRRLASAARARDVIVYD